MSRTDILEYCWCSVVALRFATAVFGMESRCVSNTTCLLVHTPCTPWFSVVTEVQVSLSNVLRQQSKKSFRVEILSNVLSDVHKGWMVYEYAI